MSNHRRRRSGEGRDRPYSAEWRAEVRAEALAALARAKSRYEAARTQRAEIKASQQRNDVLRGNGT
jgi:hypothetical protein